MEDITKAYVDTDILGKLDSSGNLTTYYNKDALNNSIICWLTSFKNDILRNPGRGGYITQLLYKPMTDQAKQNLIDAIVDGFNQDYSPRVKLLSLDVIPNYEDKTWEINILVYSDIIKDKSQVSTTINNFV
jgi:hypothetical protein